VTRRGTIAILFLLAGFLVLPGAAQACTGQNDGKTSADAQERTMLCLVNQARAARGLPALAATRSLVKAADHKSRDILRCDEFSHEACGREFTYWMTHFGYRGCSEGENIAWGSGGLGTPASISRPGCTRRVTAKISSAPTRTPASACSRAGSKATAAPTSGPRSSAAAPADVSEFSRHI
jgi:hypothetical protein